MALLFFQEEPIMSVSRFEFDAAPRPADREPRPATDDPYAAMQAAPPGDPEAAGDEAGAEPAEEPGYGHGV